MRGFAPARRGPFVSAKGPKGAGNDKEEVTAEDAD